MYIAFRSTVNSSLYVNGVISPKTHTSPWRSCSPIQQHGYGINSCPPPGNLFAMGSLRALLKGFIKFRRPATKIIYLVNRMIYFSFKHTPPHSPPADDLSIPTLFTVVLKRISSTTAVTLSTPGQWSCQAVVVKTYNCSFQIQRH